MSERQYDPHNIPWTLGNSADPNESFLISAAWVVGPALFCAVLGYFLWS
jgi:hypothetical protein